MKLLKSLSILACFLGSCCLCASEIVVTEAGLGGRVAAASDGRFVAVWFFDDGDTEMDLYGNVYDASGNLVVGPIQLDDDNSSIGSNPQPTVGAQVGMDDDGNFVVLWDSFDEDYEYRPHYRRFDAQGNPLSDAVSLLSDGDAYGVARSLSVASDGRFAIALLLSGGVRVHRFFADGTAHDTVTHSLGFASNPSIGIRAGGDYALFWSELSVSFNQATLEVESTLNRFGRSFDASGNEVASYDDSIASKPNRVSQPGEEIKINDDGSFVYYMNEAHTAPGSGTVIGSSLNLRVFDDEGPVGSEISVTGELPLFYINSTGWLSSSAALLPNGFTQVVWLQSDNMQTASTARFRTYDPDGTLIGDTEILANVPEGAFLFASDVANISNERHVVVWSYFSSDRQTSQVCASYIDISITPSSVPSLEIQPASTGNAVTISFQAASNRSYSILSSEDLSDFQEIEHIAGQSGQVERTYPVSEDQEFYVIETLAE